MILEISSQTQALPYRLHLIGIGGDGMQALAHALLDKGHFITGSDQNPNTQLKKLRNKGAQIAIGHDLDFIKKADGLIISDAISLHDPEVLEARIRDLPIYTRTQALACLGNTKETIYIAGSHGKSTTTAMVAKIMFAHDQQTSYIMGGNFPATSDQDFPKGKWGSGSYLVAEACEAFRNLDWLSPSYCLITNIDDDHIEHYGNQEKLDSAFIALLNKTPALQAIVCGDDSGIERISAQCQQRVLSYGFNQSSDYQICDYQATVTGSEFSLRYVGTDLKHTSLKLSVSTPGRHNVLNAAGAATIAIHLGIPSKLIATALHDFTGIDQRWQDHGTIHQIHVLEDFAHHPSALQALIKTARECAPQNSRLVLAYQPQLYSRTHRLRAQTLHCLMQCDAVLLLEVDPQGEIPKPSILPGGSLGLVHDLKAVGVDAHYFADPLDFLENGPAALMPNDFLVITGGSGMRNVASTFSKKLAQQPVLTTDKLPAKLPTKSIEKFTTHFSNDLIGKLKNHYLSRKMPQALLRLKGNLQHWWSEILTPSHSALRLFEQHARFHPQDLALINKEQVVSYGQLNRIAAQLAQHLQTTHHITAGQVVAVSLPSSIELIASLLALAKLGAIYLPLDQNLPSHRIASMLEQANANTLIHAMSLPPILEQTSASILIIPFSSEFLDLPKEDSFDKANRSKQEMPFLFTPNSKEDGISYICFTSGSTGIPKGVPIAWKGLADLIQDLRKQFRLGYSSRVLMNTAIGFDISLGEIWMALCSGAQLVATQSNKPLVAQALARALLDHGITHLCITPSLLHTLPYLSFPNLRCLVSVGEACHQDLVDYWAQQVNFFNAYGPTEATIYATVDRCLPNQAVTLGRAIGHRKTYVLDEQLQTTPPGTIGELYLGGSGVSPGYLQGENPGAAAFFYLRRPDHSKSDWVYRTGDLVREDAQGKLLYLGRKDRQVKILGVRIELGEIEHWLRTVPGVHTAAVLMDNQGQQPVLVGFIQPLEGHHLNEVSIVEFLSTVLQAQSIPKKIIQLDSIPLTLAAKIDYQRLAEHLKNTHSVRPFFAQARSETEKTLTILWQAVLKQEDLGVYDDFSALGGDSLKALELIDAIENQFALQVPPGYFGQITNITRLAAQIEELFDARQIETLTDFRASRIYRQQQHVVSAWQGSRKDANSLMVSLGNPDAPANLFALIQNEDELVNLHRILGDQFQVHGLRSGHLIMTYSPQNIGLLTQHYLAEITPLLKEKPFSLMGVCQGGLLALPMANYLITHSTPPTLLALVEQSRLSHYPNHLAFFYSAESYLNPALRFTNNQGRFEEIYQDRYSLDVIEGPHGSIFFDQRGDAFANAFKTRFQLASKKKFGSSSRNDEA